MEKFNSEIVEVVNNNDSIVFVCLQREEGKVVEVKWNKGDYDSALQKIVPNDKKLDQVSDWCKTYFDLDLSTIHKAVGKKIDVYVYETYSSFWESDVKFKKEDIGQKFDTEIEEVELANDAIIVRYKWNGEKYRTNYRFTEFVEGDYFVNPIKKRKQLARFEDKFGLPIDRSDELIGLPITVEIKGAFNKYAYGEISIK